MSGMLKVMELKVLEMTEVTRTIVLNQDEIERIVAHFLSGELDHTVQVAAIQLDVSCTGVVETRYSWSQSS